MNNPPSVLKQLTFLTVMAALCCTLTIICPSKAQATTTSTTTEDKLSPDLRQLLQSGQGQTKVRLIVQSEPTASTGLLGSLLQTVTGIVVSTLSALNLSIVDMKVESAAVLAADPSV